MDPVEVFAGTIMEATMLKSLLEDSKIKSYLKDEVSGTLFPWHTAPGGAGAVKVIVSESDSETALKIAAKFEIDLIG